MNPIHIITPNFFKPILILSFNLSLNIWLVVSSLLVLQLKFCKHFYLPHICYVSHSSHPPWFGNETKLLSFHYTIFSIFLSGQNTLVSILTTPYKTTSKIISTCLDRRQDERRFWCWILIGYNVFITYAWVLLMKHYK